MTLLTLLISFFSYFFLNVSYVYIFTLILILYFSLNLFEVSIKFFSSQKPLSLVNTVFTYSLLLP